MPQPLLRSEDPMAGHINALYDRVAWVERRRVPKSYLGWFNVNDYGATGDGSTDDTTAVQAAITAAFNAGGGTVYFPPGVYLCNGAFQDTGNSNCVLKIPFQSTAIASTNPPLSITLLGPGSPSNGYYLTGAANPPTSGAVLRTTKVGSGTTPSFIAGGTTPGTETPDVNFVRITVHNLGIRTAVNSNLIALQLGGVATCSIARVTVDKDVATDVLDPANQGSNDIGLWTPNNNNGASTFIEDVWVDGYGLGCMWCEHATCPHIVFMHCGLALKTQAAFHSSWIGRLGTYWCNGGIKAVGGEHAISIDVWDYEHGASPWDPSASDVDDASNYLFGAAQVYGVEHNVGYTSTFTRNGAANLRVSRLRDGSTVSLATFLDQFTRADSSTSLGGLWTTDAGTWGISSDQAALFTLTAIFSYAWVNAGVGDGSIQVDVPTFWGTVHNGGWGIAFRYTDPNNTYVADFGSASPALYKVVSGSSTSLASWSAMASGDTCMVVLSGSSITIKRVRGGVTSTLATVTDSTYDNTHHKHGFYAFGSDSVSRFDNFSVS